MNFWLPYCSGSVKKYPNHRMLGEREIVNGKVCLISILFPYPQILLSIDVYCIFDYLQAGKYVWLTYKEVHDLVLQVGVSIRSCGVGQVRLDVLLNHLI